MTRSLATAAVLAALLASAQPSAADGLDAAALQALHDEAGRLFDEKRFDEALSRYQACFDGGGPRELIYLVGRCHQEMERWSEARDAYRAYLEGPTTPEAKGRAALQLRAVEKQLATGTLVVQVTPFGAAVLLDGTEVGAAPLEPLLVAPGRHELRVEAAGFAPVVREAVIEGGRRLSVVVELAATAPPAGPEDGAEPRPGYSPWTWVTLGAGVGLLAGGTTSYLLGEKDHRAVADPDPEMTLREAVDRNDSGDTKKLVGYVLWGVGGACAATSVVLFVLDAATPAASDDGAAVQVGLSATPGGGFLDVSGRF